jgi:hypothetical protein
MFVVENTTNVIFFRAKTRESAVYADMTEPDIICIPSAFKHGVTELDIRRAFATARYDSPMEGDEVANGSWRRLLIGFNTSANPLEIMYNELDDGTVCVFHAMPCQNKYIPLLNQ